MPMTSKSFYASFILNNYIIEKAGALFKEGPFLMKIKRYVLLASKAINKSILMQ